jgi:hypothetical protein
VRYTGRIPGRMRPVASEVDPDMHSADAWIALYRAKADLEELVEVPDGADEAEVRRAWRGARMRASDTYRQLRNGGRHGRPS